jgi:GH15 family glucan-1,4-alpha-glucosidase
MTLHGSTLDLGLIGNGTLGALVDARGRIVWCCFPGFDGDPLFCSLLSPRLHEGGFFDVELADATRSEQHYEGNTAILTTRLYDVHGGAVEVVDFAPRFQKYGRMYHPTMLLRRVRPLAGQPRISVRLRPLMDYGASVPALTFGSNHVRYDLGTSAVRLTTDLPLTCVREEIPILLDREIFLVLGPDESLVTSISQLWREHYGQTQEYWREWVRNLSLPVDWQAPVIRAAVTLKLCQFEDTGAIVAAMTTSIPEAAHSARNWDYRYCWLRDAAFVVRALNRLGATRTMTEYLRFIANIVTNDEVLQPMYGIHYERELVEGEAHALAGYRHMGPVRIGNAAWTQLQHDVYGSVILAATQLFFDQRIDGVGDAATFARLEPLGEQARLCFDKPDAGIWEYRGRTSVHTYSAVMCWAACDRLARIATHLGIADRATYWRVHADTMRQTILENAWNPRIDAFTSAFGEDALDASVLVMHEVGFLPAGDARFIATVDAIAAGLRQGDHLFRYRAADDFGVPETAFNICTFWYVDALAAIGRRDEAREWFERLLKLANPLGLFSEDMDPHSGEAWGNFPQTYSLVGLIQAAMRLSRRWEDVV